MKSEPNPEIWHDTAGTKCYLFLFKPYSALKYILVGILLVHSVRCAVAESKIKVAVCRLPGNPIITHASSESLGNKINGPSVIRVPSWVKSPLGKYYLYFAHHKGQFIRLAYADSMGGPWEIYEPGTLHLSQTPLFYKHIASPDVHVDVENKEIRMYFHGSRAGEKQKTSVATSIDGINFEASDSLLGDAYFRVFQWGEYYYAIDTHGFLNRSLHPEKGWVRRQEPLISPIAVVDEFGHRTNVRIRHSAVWLQEDSLYLFYSRKADAPERILLTRVPLTNEWNGWSAEAPIEILRPETVYEGIKFPISPSTKGGAIAVQQLRDPYVFFDAGRLYLFYTVAGEMGIAVAEIAFQDK